MFNNPTILLELLYRDEFKLDESKVWPNFTEKEVLPVTLTGIFLIPGKLLVAVGKPIKGLSEVPCISIAKNSWPYGV